MRVEDELLGRALVEGRVSLRGVLERDGRGLHVLRDAHLVVEDRLHEPAVVLHDGALPGHERVGLREAQAEPHGQGALLRRLVDRAGVTRDVEAGDAQPATRSGDLHERVEDGGRGLGGRVRTVTAGLEAHGVDAAVDLGHAQDLLDLLGRVALRHVDGLAAEAAGLRQPVLIQVAHDYDRSAQELGGGRCGKAHRSGTGDVHRRPHGHASAHRTVEAGGEDVGEHREVEDLLHRLIPVRELQDVPVRVGHQHVLRLAAHPAAHVDVAVRGAGAVRVHVQADAGLSLLAVAAAAAGDVERNGDDIAHLHELDVAAHLDHLAGDLVSQHQSFRCGRAAPDHVLVGTADVRGDRLEDDAVVHLPAHVGRVHAWPVLEFELRVRGVDDLDPAGSCVADCTVAHR